LATSILPDQARQRRTKVIDQPEPPRCEYNNSSNSSAPSHPDGLSWKTCPVCRARRSWVAALRRKRTAIGEHIPDHSTNRGRRPDPKLRQPVPKCRLTHASAAERRACTACKARDRFVSALRRDAQRDGQHLVGMVDATEVAAYVNNVLVPSGLTFVRISELAGVSFDAVRRVASGKQKHILSINAPAILTVEPLPYRQGIAGLVNAAGTRRKLRGLSAQGWMVGYMAELEGVSFTTFHSWIVGRTNADHTGQYVTVEVAATADRLVAKLGEFDIAELDEPMDGMSAICARRAAKRGWNVLSDWDGLDIDDPRVTPHGHDETVEASNGLVLVDYNKVKRALDFLPTEAADGSLSAEQFTLPLTKMEIYEIIRVGSERDHAGEPRFSANLLGQRIGANERTIIRYRSEMARANWGLDAGPALPVAAAAAALILAAAEWPAALRLQVASSMLASYPLGRGGFYRYLVILGATQHGPIGRQWSDARLADWLGCAEEDAAELRAKAVLAGRQYQEFPTDGRTGRSRNLGVQLPAAAA
jgi:hypothetical protein